MIGKRKTSCASSNRRRKRILGSTGWSALAQSRRGLRSKSISTCKEDKEVTGNSQHGFTRVRLCLIDLMAFYDKNTGSVDKGKNSRCCSV